MAGVVEAVTGSRWRALGVGIVLGLALLAAALPLTAFGGGDGGGEIFLAPAGDVGPDPFTDALFVTPVSIAAVLPQGMDELDEGVSALVGDDAGLYGGTKDDARCDADLLIEFLTNPRNSYKATAWAGVHGIEVDEIDDYVNGLTPMVLRQDVRVTNHGFRSGEAVPLQSVLQAGTAVLVDDEGVPRVRCACGNPLLEPEAVAGDVSYEGEAWAGFDERALFRMTPGEVEERFILVDLTTGDLFERPIGGDGSTDRFLGEDDADEDEEGDDILVPDVAGLTLDAALDELEARGLMVTIVEKADEDVADGRVVVTDPPAGSSVGDGDEILVIVSTGPAQPPAPEPVETSTTVVDETSTSSPSSSVVPTTVRRTTTTRRPTTQPPPTQPPPTRATTTTTIRRTTTTTSTTTTTVAELTVPDVSGLPVDAAQKRLQATGLVVGQAISEPIDRDELDGIVYETEPKIGTSVEPESLVHLYYYVYVPVIN